MTYLCTSCAYELTVRYNIPGPRCPICGAAMVVKTNGRSLLIRFSLRP